MFNVPQYSDGVSYIKWHAFAVYILDQILALEVQTEVLDGHGFVQTRTSSPRSLLQKICDDSEVKLPRYHERHKSKPHLLTTQLMKC